MKLDYKEQYPNGLGGTICPNLPRNPDSIFNIHIGSFACQTCEYFSSQSHTYKFVHCDYKPPAS